MSFMHMYTKIIKPTMNAAIMVGWSYGLVMGQLTWESNMAGQNGVIYAHVHKNNNIWVIWVVRAYGSYGLVMG